MLSRNSNVKSYDIFAGEISKRFGELSDGEVNETYLKVRTFFIYLCQGPYEFWKVLESYGN